MAAATASPAAGAPAPAAAAAVAALARALGGVRRAAASARLRQHLESAADPGAVAVALVSQPESQIRAYGLLAARLAGRPDLLLAALRGDAHTWKAAACLLCQMSDLPADAVAEAVRWALHEASPAQRGYFYTRAGRLPAPHPLGAALFGALLAAGKPRDALRLARHAEPADAELAELARTHMVQDQAPLGRVATWARQAWQRLAVARPRLCLELLQELLGRVKAAAEERGQSCEDGAVHMLRRAVLALLHGKSGAAAAAALQVNEDEQEEEKEQGRLLPLLGRRERHRFKWDAARRLMECLAAEQAAGAAPAPEADEQAWRLYCMVLQQGHSAQRWAYRLHRRGLLLRVLRQAGLEGLNHKLQAAKHVRESKVHAEVLPCLARLAVPQPGAAAALLASVAAADARLALFGKHQSFGSRPGDEDPRWPWARWLRYGDGNHCPRSVAMWPLEVVIKGVVLLRQQYQDGTDKAAVLDRVLGFLRWTPEHRAATLGMMRNQQDIDERAGAYRNALTFMLPPNNPEAVNDLVPWCLKRIRNECATVRIAVLSALYPHSWYDVSLESDPRLAPDCLLACLADEHLPALEDALAAALAAPDARDELPQAVHAAAAEVLRQGVLRPDCQKLEAGLRLYAMLLKRSGGGAHRPYIFDRSAWDSYMALSPALDALRASTDAPAVVRRLLDQLRLLCQAAGDQSTESELLGRLLSLSGTDGLRWLRGLPELSAMVERELRRSFPHSRWEGKGPADPLAALAPAAGGTAALDGVPAGDAVAGHAEDEEVMDTDVVDSEDTEPQQAGQQGSRNSSSMLTDSGAAEEQGDAADSGIAEGQGGQQQLEETGEGGDREQPVGSLLEALRRRRAKRRSEDSAADEDRRQRSKWTKACIFWWLGDPDDALVLSRAQALLEGPGGAEALHAFISADEYQFLPSDLLPRTWFAAEASNGQALPPCTQWWQEWVLRDRHLLQWAVKHCSAQDCRRLLRREGPDGPLCRALLREEVWSWKLATALPEYYSACLAAELAEGNPKQRDRYSWEKCGVEAAVEAFGESREASYWECKRALSSADLRRWPPAIQAQLRKAFASVAADAKAEPKLRLAAVCLLARLQDTTIAELAPLAAEQDLTAACLLAASGLPDKRETARRLAGKLTHLEATHAAAALARLASHLTDAELAELCGDQLSTAGLRTAAWQRLVVMLLERGTPEALELVFAEMRRPDLSASMRRGLVEATRPLVELPQVAAFWEESAALRDKEVDAALLVLPDSEALQSPEEAARWWAGLVMGMLLRAVDGGSRGELLRRVSQLQSCLSGLLQGGHIPVVDAFVGHLLELAASQPANGWDVALWLLQRLSPSVRSGYTQTPANPRLLKCLARRLVPLVHAAGVEQAHGGGPSTRLLMHLFGPASSFASPWELGLDVAPLMPLLWLPFCKHTASNVARVATEQGGAALAAELAEALNRAPSAPHAWELAAAVAGHDFRDLRAKRRSFAGAVLQAAQALSARGTADQAGQGSAAAAAGGHVLLAAALVAAGWQALHSHDSDDGRHSCDGSEDAQPCASPGEAGTDISHIESELLALLRALLAAQPVGAQVRLLLDPFRSSSRVRTLLAAATDSASLEESAALKACGEGIRGVERQQYQVMVRRRRPWRRGGHRSTGPKPLRLAWYGSR